MASIGRWREKAREGERRREMAGEGERRRGMAGDGGRCAHRVEVMVLLIIPHLHDSCHVARGRDGHV